MESCVADKSSVFNTSVTAHMLLPSYWSLWIHDFSLCCMKKQEANPKLLLHTAVRWLSWSKVLVWLFTLQNEIMLFLFEFSFNLSWLWFWAVAVCVLFWWYLFKPQWTELVTSGYICDGIFSLWWKWSKVTDVQFWASCVKKENIKCFPKLHDF